MQETLTLETKSWWHLLGNGKLFWPDVEMGKALAGCLLPNRIAPRWLIAKIRSYIAAIHGSMASEDASGQTKTSRVCSNLSLEQVGLVNSKKDVSQDGSANCAKKGCVVR